MIAAEFAVKHGVALTEKACDAVMPQRIEIRDFARTKLVSGERLAPPGRRTRLRGSPTQD
jgi:hypothetical protein